MQQQQHGQGQGQGPGGGGAGGGVLAAGGVGGGSSSSSSHSHLTQQRLLAVEKALAMIEGLVSVPLTYESLGLPPPPPPPPSPPRQHLSASSSFSASATLGSETSHTGIVAGDERAPLAEAETAAADGMTDSGERDVDRRRPSQDSTAATIPPLLASLLEGDREAFIGGGGGGGGESQLPSSSPSPLAASLLELSQRAFSLIEAGKRESARLEAERAEAERTRRWVEHVACIALHCIGGKGVAKSRESRGL